MGKDIELTMFGEDTELDKSLAEEIVDPLMHLVRNAIDHGIEPVDERKRLGKNEHGIIILKAFQKGNYVVIEVSDDGRGINIQKVREKAVEKGLIESDSGMDEQELINLIFAPGFSTKEMVSELSGRGVGMDVVKEKLAMLGGFSEVYTRRNEGTTFTLTLPITLAIIKALIVQVGQVKFAVPLTAMSETIAIERKDLQTVEKREVFFLRGEMLPIVSIGNIFQIPVEQNEVIFAVVVGFGRRKLGILVDEIIGQQEIVIKSLGEYFKGMGGFAGAAEIGRHEVILVLDVESILERSLLKYEAGPHV